jgi:hypothetical protein
MQVAGTRVEVDRGSSPIVRVNGAVTTLGSSTRTLPGGGTVAEVSGNIVVTWPDGTQAQLWGVGPWGVAYLVQPAAARAGHLAGLLGAFNGDPGHLTGRDGRVYAVSTLEGKRGFDLKYHHFGESWRISQAQSLFTYPRGKSTASYTDRRVPRKILSLSSLPTRQRSQAERTCRGRGIKRKLILHDCVYDVVVTKHKAFASSGARLQRTASTHHKTTPPPPPPPPPGGGTEQFTTTCYSDDTIVPAGQVQNVPPGTFAGIEADLNPRVGMAVTVAHWTAPDGGIDELNPTGGTNYNEFAEMDIPGQYSVYVTYAGDGTHSAARSATCMWNVTG